MIFTNMPEKRNKVALLDGDGSMMTYEQLEKRANDIAGCMEYRSVILLLFDIDIETVSFYYSAIQYGNVPILINPKESSDHICRICEKYNPRYIWCSENNKNLVGMIISVLQRFNSHVLYCTAYDKYEISPELALLLTTSGSTGSSKMVRLSYDNIKHNTAMVNELLCLTEEDRGITSLPLYHCYGLSILHMLWQVGGSIVLYDDTVLNPKYAGIIKDYNVTISLLVPYSYDLIRMSSFESLAYDSLRILLMGGGKQKDDSRISFIEWCKLHGISSYFMYGQTEGTTYLASTGNCDYTDTENIGKALGSLTAHIENEYEDGLGELVIEGHSVSLGYAESFKDLIRSDDNHGKLYTGDLVRIDEDESIHLKGRIKRIAKILGERISLDELENYLNITFKENIFVCLESIEVVLIVYEGQKLAESLICKKLEENTGMHRQMIKVRHIETIPRLSNGKVDYVGLGALK